MWSIFHDSPAIQLVDISGADVNLASTVFDNTSATAYTLQGTKGISTGTITKTNNGSLAITNANITSGAVALNGGTVLMAQSGDLGTGPVSFGGGQSELHRQQRKLVANLSFNAATDLGVSDCRHHAYPDWHSHRNRRVYQVGSRNHDPYRP